jgi:hypothetical protein
MANRDILELVFKHSGGVELRAIEANGRDSSNDVDAVVWASDSDQDFTDEFGGEELFDADEHAEKVLDYLVEADVIDDDEAEGVRIFSESLDGRDVEDIAADPDDDDDDDDLVLARQRSRHARPV